MRSVIPVIAGQEREKKLYRMTPLIGFMYRTFGTYRKENMQYFEETEKAVIEWIGILIFYPVMALILAKIMTM